MTIVFRPQICDVISPYLYAAASRGKYDVFDLIFAHIGALHYTKAVQPVATCRQSPYLHKPAIVIVTSFSLWRLAPTALATPVLIMTSFSLWRHSPLRAYVTDTLPCLIYNDFGKKSIYHNYFCVGRTNHCLFTFKISTSYVCHDMFGQCRADIVSKLKFWHRIITGEQRVRI